MQMAKFFILMIHFMFSTSVSTPTNQAETSTCPSEWCEGNKYVCKELGMVQSRRELFHKHPCTHRVLVEVRSRAVPHGEVHVDIGPFTSFLQNIGVRQFQNRRK